MSEAGMSNLTQRKNQSLSKASGIDNPVTSGAHIGAGVISAYVLSSVMHQPVTPVMLGVAIGLSLLPDLDTIWVRARQRRQGVQGRVNHHALSVTRRLFI